MNWDIVQGNWEQVKGKVQKQWGALTSDDLDTIRGQKNELVGKLRERYGWAKEDAEQKADDFVRTLREPIND